MVLPGDSVTIEETADDRGTKNGAILGQDGKLRLKVSGLELRTPEFIGRPVVEQRHLIEFAAQTAAVGALSNPASAGKIPLFASVADVVMSGDATLEDSLEVRITNMKSGKIGTAEAGIYVHQNGIDVQIGRIGVMKFMAVDTGMVN
jgi:hypothetical protein